MGIYQAAGGDPSGMPDMGGMGACLELEEPLLELDPLPDPPSRKLIKQSSIYRTVWHRDVCKSSIYRTEWHQRVCKRKVSLNKTNIWLLSKTVHSFLTVYGINMY